VIGTLRGATVVLTGASTGIGRATALALAGQAGRLILHGLEPESEIGDLLGTLRGSGAEIDYLSADYGEPADVGRLARDIREKTDRIDLLINNAARPGAPTRMVTKDGVEVTFQTNYLAPVQLTTRLLDLVSQRIINIVSETHFSATLRLDDLSVVEGENRERTPSGAYAHSKLALVTYTNWLAAHRPDPEVDMVSQHPGVISTGLLHAMFAIEGASPEHAASNIEYVAGLRGDNGTYYDERRPQPPNPQASDRATQERLHEITVHMLDKERS
jgi:NAD(P)-dependent dehydrogenase (short-subunit alcohol dehydrogenase family)